MRGKRGQVAIFIIVAIVIVGAVLAVFIYPRIRLAGGAEFTASSYLKSCLEPKLRSSIELLGKNGGYANPEGFIVYQDQKVKYLCYTNEYYKQCIVQQPLIKNNFEKELKALIEPEARTCLSNLKAEYEKRGYSVSTGTTETGIEIAPSKIKVDMKAPITITKEQSETFREHTFDIDSQMYDLLMIATSVVDFETTYGDSETTLYMQYYPNLKIEKISLGDGSKVYKLSDVTTNEQFIFASRSVVFPPGYTGK